MQRTNLLEDVPCAERRGKGQENCKVGVWSIFRPLNVALAGKRGPKTWTCPLRPGLCSCPGGKVSPLANRVRGCYDGFPPGSWNAHAQGTTALHSTPKFAALAASIPVLVALWANSPLVADEEPFWPRFHGPKGDNISADTGLLTEWPEQGPQLLWTAQPLGKGYPGVTIANGLIHTAGDIGDHNVITALDMTMRWISEVPS